MEELERVGDTATGWLSDLLTAEIYNGQSLNDYLTFDALATLTGNLVAATLIVTLGIILSGFFSRRLRRVGERYKRVDDTLFNFLANIVRYVILGFTALFVLNTFGVQTTSVVAVIGAAGLAIGLALQGTLSNVAAGVMLIVFRPLRVGDFVEIDGAMGTVKEITLNYIELASVGNVQVVVPNSEVWGNKIVNYSAYTTRRAEWTFGVGYGANLAEAERTILDTIMADPRSHAEPAPFIQVNALNASSVDFLVRVWCDSADYFQYQADMKRKVKEALDAAGIEIPFPTTTVLHEGRGLVAVPHDKDGIAAE